MTASSKNNINQNMVLDLRVFPKIVFSDECSRTLNNKTSNARAQTATTKLIVWKFHSHVSKEKNIKYM